MRRISRYTLACLALIAASACSDTATGPGSGSARSLVPANRPTLSVAGADLFAGYRTTSFAVTANGGSFAIGNLFTVNFPANSICDPAVSGYGPGTWENSCRTLADGQTLTITATYGFHHGAPVVDFSPALRFNPTATVTISTGIYAPILTLFKNYWTQYPQALYWLGVHYTPDLGQTTVVDDASDQSLRTHVNLTTGLVWRRIKHFSGYLLTSGEPCTPSPDNPDCVDDGGPIIQQ